MRTLRKISKQTISTDANKASAYLCFISKVIIGEFSMEAKRYDLEAHTRYLNLLMYNVMQWSILKDERKEEWGIEILKLRVDIIRINLATMREFDESEIEWCYQEAVKDLKDEYKEKNLTFAEKCPEALKDLIRIPLEWIPEYEFGGDYLIMKESDILGILN